MQESTRQSLEKAGNILLALGAILIFYALISTMVSAHSSNPCTPVGLALILITLGSLLSIIAQKPRTPPSEPRGFEVILKPDQPPPPPPSENTPNSPNQTSPSPSPSLQKDSPPGQSER